MNLEGRTLGHYENLERLGAGAMGEVYAATDTHLKRRVALKILPPELAGDVERRQRFQLEAEAIAALDHPNIITIHSLEEAPDPTGGGTIHFLTMELVAGERLDESIPEGGLPLDRFHELARQLTSGVAAAHGRGVVHRDLKPANVMITADGRLKILDFGLAKLRDPMAGSALESDLPTALMTQEGRVIGTPAYMAPEQVEGRGVDARSDVFALGAVFYEMLTGRRPFAGDSLAALHAAILSGARTPVRSERKDVPADLEALVDRCLRRDPEDRFASADELATALEARAPAGAEAVIRERRWKKRILIPGGALVIALVLLSVSLIGRQRRVAQVRNEVLPEIERLLDEHRMYEGFELVRQAEKVLPEDPLLGHLRDRASYPTTLVTEPPGAEIAYKEYRAPQREWLPLGISPLEAVRVPQTYLRVRFAKPGYQSVELGLESEALRHVVELTPLDSTPEGMLWVPKGRYTLGVEQPVEVPGFWLDRYEVTNRRFQEFVDAGGYSNPEYWKQPFERQGRILERAEAMALFVDSTGRPGPSTWSLGRFRAGEDEHPVRGVSWFEAAAYAEFAGKSLPSLYHWRRGAPWSLRGEHLIMSNLEGEAVAPVGAFDGVGRYGHSDLAGNVAEWCWNRTSDERRYQLGGSWLDPSYFFTNNVAQDPFERQPNMGFRLASFEEAPPPELMEGIGVFRHDFRLDEPVSDEVFAFYRTYFEYQPQPLDSRLEAVDDGHPEWRRETVSFTAGYGGERVLAHLFLPKRASPPYQTMVLMPHSGARVLASIDDAASDIMLFVPRAGRALVWPAYKGTLERGGGAGGGAPEGRVLRDELVMRVNDLQRTVDYLETRDDVVADRLGYIGLSYGGEYGPIYTAIENRFEVVVLLAGGLDDAHMLGEPTEMLPLHYAPRVEAPVLLVNGESDYGIPVETGQRPLFDRLGTPAEHKKHVILEGGHLPYDWNAVVRETLDWLDRYQGPVSR